MRIDGLPGVRSCVTKVQPGMIVKREHAWPNADHDLLRAAELLGPLMPPGFYYRWFRHSPRLWHVFERGLARLAGQGDMPSPAAVQRLKDARCTRKDGTDVLVVGGGVAGLSAALAAADEGARVLLLQRSDRLGGGLADSGAPRHDDQLAGETNCLGAVDLPRLTIDVQTHVSIEILIGAEAIGWYEEGTIAVDMNPDLLLVEPSAVILATGAYEQGIPFPNCDLPGVMLSSGARRLLARHGVCAGSTAVFVANDDSAYEVALQLAGSGVKISCVADCRPSDDLPTDGAAIAALREKDVKIIPSARDLRAYGFNRVSAFSLVTPEGATCRTDCDLVCASGGFRPADELRYQGLSQGAVTLSLPARIDSVQGERHQIALWMVGHAGGARSHASALGQGQTVGRAAGRFARAEDAGRQGRRGAAVLDTAP